MFDDRHFRWQASYAGEPWLRLGLDTSALGGAISWDPGGTVFDGMVQGGVPADLRSLFCSTWTDLASPGSGWTGTERVAIASVARAARVGDQLPVTRLPHAALEAVSLVSARPAHASEPWVQQAVSSLGQTQYVELVGVVAIVAGVDTVTELLGIGLEPLPEPLPGDPIPDRPNPRLKRRSAWVAMTGPPLPRHALTAAPSMQAVANRLLDRLYMSSEELRSNEPVRGLSRWQMEIVILSLSLSNECFY